MMWSKAMAVGLAAFALAAAADQGNLPSRADAAASCRTTRTVVVVNLDNRRHRDVLRHAWRAIASGEVPEVWNIDRAGADAHRDASLRGVPSWGELTVAQRQRIDPDGWRRPHDRDEVPPAVARQGGKGADVAYVDSSENRSAGAVMLHELAPFCDGTRFRYERKPGPKPRGT